jgi:hypothetical protein
MRRAIHSLKHQKTYVIRELINDFFGEYKELLDQKRIQQQQECVGWNWNPEENATKDETNENPRKESLQP